MAARAQRAAHFSCAAGAKILPRGHQNTNFSMKKRDQTCPRKVAFRGASRCSSRRALVSSPLCCGLLLLCCCCCCTGCCCARASKAAAVHSARATRLEMSHEHCRHVRACSQALRFCSARQRSLPPRSGGLWERLLTSFRVFTPSFSHQKSRIIA